MTLKTIVMAALAATALGATALPASAHCACACKTSHHVTAKKTKTVRTSAHLAKKRTIVKVRTVVVEKPVVVERIVYRDAPPPRQVVYVDDGHTYCHRSVRVTYRHRQGWDGFRGGRHLAWAYRPAHHRRGEIAFAGHGRW